VTCFSFVRGGFDTNNEQLQRHGARWPTTNSAEDMKAAVKKLKRAKHYKEDYLEFLENFYLDLEEESLLPLGAKQCVSMDGNRSPI